MSDGAPKRIVYNREVRDGMAGRTLRGGAMDEVLRRAKDARLPIIESRLGDPTRYPGFETPNPRYMLFRLVGMHLGFARSQGLDGHAVAASLKASGNRLMEEAAEIAQNAALVRDMGRMWGYESASGLAELREMLGLGSGEFFGETKLPASQIFVGAGISGVVSSMFDIILGSGGEVVTPDWCYTLYSAEAARMRSTLKMVELDGGGQVDLERLKASIAANTAAVVVTTVGNPIGVGMEPEVFDKIVEIVNGAERRLNRPIFFLVDTIYEGYRMDRDKRINPITRSRNSGRIGPTVDLHGFSKMIGAPGDRIGWGSVYWPEESFPGHRAAFFGEMEILLPRLLGSVASEVQMAAYLFFRELNADINRMDEYHEYKRMRREESFRRTTRLINGLAGIDGMCFPPQYFVGGKLDAGVVANSFYVVVGVDRRLASFRYQGMPQAAAVGDYAITFREIAVPLMTPAGNFRLGPGPHEQDYSRIVGLLGDAEQDQLMSVMRNFVMHCRTVEKQAANGRGGNGI